MAFRPMDLIEGILGLKKNSTVQPGRGITLKPRTPEPPINDSFGLEDIPTSEVPPSSPVESAIKVIPKEGRLKAGLKGMLQAIGEQATQNMAAGRTSWTDVAGIAGKGVGGLVVNAADPGIRLKARVKKEKDEAEAVQNRDIAVRKANADIASTEAAAEDLRSRDARQAKQLQREKEHDDALKAIAEAQEQGRINAAQARTMEREAERNFQIKMAEDVRQFKREEAEKAREFKRGLAGSKPSADNSDKVGKARTQKDALNQEADEHEEAARSYQAQLDKLYGDGSKDKYGDYVNQSERTRLEKLRDNAIAKGKAARAKANRVYVPKASQASSNSASAPQKTFSPSAWQQANPGKDVNKAITKAKALGMVIGQ